MWGSTCWVFHDFFHWKKSMMQDKKKIHFFLFLSTMDSMKIQRKNDTKITSQNPNACQQKQIENENMSWGNAKEQCHIHVL
jgi:hypothetical protein